MRMRLRQLNMKNREVSERKQVGDAESIFSEGTSKAGMSGFYGSSREGQL